MDLLSIIIIIMGIIVAGFVAIGFIAEKISERKG
jgi:hypothetical protein